MLKKVVFSLFCFIFISSHVHSGGFILYEIGTPDVGLASAGWAARAEDASTVFTNPAGMTRFGSPEVLVGAQPLYLHIHFDPNSETTVAGSNGNASGWLPAGGTFFVTPATDRVSIGAAMLGYFGSSINYGHHWVGRYYLTRTTCQGFSFLPGAAIRLTDCFSIGVCANVMYAIDRSHAQVNNELDDMPDGRMRVTGNNWAVGAVVGALFEPNECTRFGITYVSEVKQKFRMKPKFLGIGPQLTSSLEELGILGSRVRVTCNAPNWVMVSAYQKMNSYLALMGNIGWQQWSKFARAEVSLNNLASTSLTLTPKYSDTWHVAVGGEYYLDCSKATFGIAYDSSIVSNKNRTPSIPIGKQWRFGAGYQFFYSECLRMGAAYEFSWTGDLKLFQDRGPLAGTLAGKFKNVYAHFLNLNFIWDF